MGKRLSGCDPQAAYPAQSQGLMSMMNMMTGGWSSPFRSNQGNNPMMGNFGNLSMLGGWGGLSMVVWWVLIIAGIVALVAWLSRQGRAGGGINRLSALDVLKERYAKGEINKQEFEEKKRGLV
jgi:putative membrane protein